MNNSGPMPKNAAKKINSQKTAIMLIPCFINPIYISPAPGIREKQKVKKLLFFLVISLPPDFFPILFHPVPYGTIHCLYHIKNLKFLCFFDLMCGKYLSSLPGCPPPASAASVPSSIHGLSQAAAPGHLPSASIKI